MSAAVVVGGRLTGIVILDASANLSADLLDQAEIISQDPTRGALFDGEEPIGLPQHQARRLARHLPMPAALRRNG